VEGWDETPRPARDRHCDACFSGDYPLAGTDEAAGKFALELPLVRA
jgi:amidophosphoribosyltransferase